MLYGVDSKGGAVFHVTVICEKSFRSLFICNGCTIEASLSTKKSLKVAFVMILPGGTVPMSNCKSDLKTSPGIALRPTSNTSAGPKF